MRDSMASLPVSVVCRSACWACAADLLASRRYSFPAGVALQPIANDAAVRTRPRFSCNEFMKFPFRIYEGGSEGLLFQSRDRSERHQAVLIRQTGLSD